MLPLVFLAFISFTAAHFTLTTPSPIGASSNPNGEGTGPCGGFTASSSSFTSPSTFYVSGSPVSFLTGHPQVNILIRGTLDITASSNWTNLFPVVAQYDLGSFCEPAVPVPAAWAGKNGILQVVQDGEDGLLYQCAAVTFMAGTPPALPAACTNASSVSASFTTDSNLPAGGAPNSAFGPVVAGNGTAATSISTASMTTTAAAATSKTSEAMEIRIGWLVILVVLALGFVGLC